MTEEEKKSRFRYGEHSIQGKRKTQEDSHICLLHVKDKNSIPSDPPLALFGVFDGHGGRIASEFVAEHLPQYVCEETTKRKETNQEDLPGALAAAIGRIEEDFLKKAMKEELRDGTTAIIAMLEVVGNQLVIGNVGDSELILSNGGKALSLCPVHNPKRNPEEVKRVESEGGKLFNDRLTHPCLSPVFFNIAVSRAIGDIFFKHTDYTKHKPSGLSAQPDIVSYQLNDQDEFAVLACDGLWDVMTHQEVVDFVLPRLKEKNDPQGCSEQLVAEAYERGSQDNITALIVTFKPSF